MQRLPFLTAWLWHVLLVRATDIIQPTRPRCDEREWDRVSKTPAKRHGLPPTPRTCGPRGRWRCCQVAGGAGPPLASVCPQRPHRVGPCAVASAVQQSSYRSGTAGPDASLLTVPRRGPGSTREALEQVPGSGGDRRPESSSPGVPAVLTVQSGARQSRGAVQWGMGRTVAAPRCIWANHGPCLV